MKEEKRMTEKIWIVEGSTGEYSDANYWQVCAFRDEQKAKDYTEELCKLCKCIDTLCNYNDEYELDECGYYKQIIKLDPRFIRYYTGTYYTAYEVELR